MDYLVSAEKRIKGSQNQGMQMETGKKRGKSVQEARKCGIMTVQKPGTLDFSGVPGFFVTLMLLVQS